MEKKCCNNKPLIQIKKYFFLKQTCKLLFYKIEHILVKTKLLYGKRKVQTKFFLHILMKIIENSSYSLLRIKGGLDVWENQK